MKKISELIHRLENHPAPFRTFVTLFFAILSIRLCLEFFSSRRLFRFEDYVHIGFWFIFIVSCFTVLLSAASGEKISKVAKVVIPFFSLALTAPILDMIISGGIGYKMSYLSLHSWRDVAWSYSTIGGSSFSRGATPGIRIEIVILLIATFNYLRIKGKSIFRALLAAVLIYSALFFSGAIPHALKGIIDFFNLEYGTSDYSTSRFLFLLNVFLLSIGLCLHDPQKVVGLLRKLEWKYILIMLLCSAAGFYASTKDVNAIPWVWDAASVFIPPLLLILALGIGAVYAGETSGIYFSSFAKNVLLVFVLIVSLLLGFTMFFLVTVFLGFLYLLYFPPLKLISIPGVAAILFGCMFCAAMLFGFCLSGIPMIGFPWKLFLISGLPAFLIRLIRDFR